MSNHYYIRAFDNQGAVLCEWYAQRSEFIADSMVDDLFGLHAELIPADAVGLRIYRNHEPIKYFPVIEDMTASQIEAQQ